VSGQISETVGNLIKALEDVEWNIVKPQETGGNLAVDRLVVTVNSTWFDPIDVLSVEDANVGRVLDVMAEVGVRMQWSPL
jgi:hypothetical protein